MLDVVEALESGRPLDTALNVPNEESHRRPRGR